MDWHKDLIKIRKITSMGRVFKVIRRRVKTDGLCCPVDEKITINPDARNQQVTYLHEVYHSAVFSGGIFEALEGNHKLIEVICEQFARTVDENFILIPREHTKCPKK